MFANTKSGGLGILRRHILKSSFLGIACCVGISMYALYIYDRETWDTMDRYLQDIPHPFGIDSPVIQDGLTGGVSDEHTQSYCTAAEYANGRWIHRINPPSTLDEIRTFYGLTDRARIECNPPSLPISAKGQVPIEDPDHLARILNNTRWRWEPRNECQRHELSLEAFVVRMLRSRAGTIFIGDSLMEQHHQIVRNFMISSDGPFRSTSYGNRPRVDQFHLRPEDNRSKRYLELAGVTEDRLQNPISTFILERHLLSPNEYDQVFEHLDGYIPLSTEDGPHQWVAESIWDAEVHKLLEKPITPDQLERVAGLAEEPTVFVLSTGPHWLAREVTNEKGVSDEDLLTGYGNMVDRVLTNLTTIHQSADIKIWYRASTPGHVDCKDIQEPVVENPTWTPHPEAQAWNWHLMEPFNDIWRNRIGEAHSAGLRIAYLDVYPMSLQRGDSHLLPPNDCLHFCYQGVVEEWQQLLWQGIVRDSLNGDYDIGSPTYL